jgi:hypothetical protein
VTRYKTYEVLKAELNNPKVLWAYLPYSMHMAGPREAIQHMIIRKNYGCTHFIIGRDMAGSKSCLDGEDFYGAYDAQVSNCTKLVVGGHWDRFTLPRAYKKCFVKMLRPSLRQLPKLPTSNSMHCRTKLISPNK